MTARIALLLAILLFGASTSHASFGQLDNGQLDQKALRTAYLDSEFNNVALVLESFLKANPPNALKVDRIFAFKYLGVIYASDSKQSARAEQNFNRLFELSPNIELIDMFVSPKIQLLFDNVKADLKKRQEYSSQYDELGMPIKQNKDSIPSPPEKPRKSSRKWIWWTTAGTVVAAGAAYLIWFEFIKEPEPNITKVQ